MSVLPTLELSDGCSSADRELIPTLTTSRMSDDTQVSDDENEDSTTTTPDAESEKDTSAGAEDKTETSETDKGEEKDKANKTAFNESLLETEDSKKTPPTAEVKREDAYTQKTKQIEVWVNRFDGRINPKTGNPYQFSDLPEDKEWLQQEVADALHEKEVTVAPKVEEKKVDTEFEALKAKIPELPQSKQEEIAKDFKSLKEDGIQSDAIALARALKNASIEIEAEKRGKKSVLMGAPGGGSSGGVNAGEKDTMTPAFRKKAGITKAIEKKAKNFNFLNPNEDA